MLKHWIEAFRLRTLPLALACIGMGGIIAYTKHSFEPTIFSLTLLTAFLLQILSNLANDYGDAINGADSKDRLGPSRMVQAGKIAQSAMRNAIIVFVLLSFISGMSLLYLSISSLQEFWMFLGMGLLSIFAAITYTVGKNPYGYAGFGDISVLIFFGAIAVGGSYYLQVNRIDTAVIFPALTCGLFGVAVLNVNNIRDITSDQKAGKYSIPVRLGRTRAIYYHWALLSLAWLAIIVYTIMDYRTAWQWLFLLSTPLFLINARAVYIHKDPKKLDPYLKQMAISTLIFVFIYGIGQYLSI